MGYKVKNYGIYWVKAMGYIGQNLWYIFGKNYKIYSATTMRYIGQKLWLILG